MPLGGSWVVISRVISRITMVVTYIRALLTPLVTTHEPPSTLDVLSLDSLGFGAFAAQRMAPLPEGPLI